MSNNLHTFYHFLLFNLWWKSYHQNAWTLKQCFCSKQLDPKILYQILSILDFKSVKSASLKSRFGYCSSVSLYFVAYCLLSVLPVIVGHRSKMSVPKMWLQHYHFPAKLQFAYCEHYGFWYFIGWQCFELTYPSGL